MRMTKGRIIRRKLDTDSVPVINDGSRKTTNRIKTIITPKAINICLNFKVNTPINIRKPAYGMINQSGDCVNDTYCSFKEAE